MSASRDRKNRILGDRCAICPRCGWARRYLIDGERPPDEPCPDCGRALVMECPACGAPPESIAQVDCRDCGRPLRDAQAFGGPIRRRAEPVRTTDRPAP